MSDASSTPFPLQSVAIKIWLHAKTIPTDNNSLVGCVLRKTMAIRFRGDKTEPHALCLLVGSEAGAVSRAPLVSVAARGYWGPQRFRPVSSLRHLERSVRISRTTLSCSVLGKGYETYQHRSAFRRSSRRNRW